MVRKVNICLELVDRRLAHSTRSEVGSLELGLGHATARRRRCGCTTCRGVTSCFVIGRSGATSCFLIGRRPTQYHGLGRLRSAREPEVRMRRRVDVAPGQVVHADRLLAALVRAVDCVQVRQLKSVDDAAAAAIFLLFRR